LYAGGPYIGEVLGDVKIPAVLIDRLVNHVTMVP
jgi:hypothetical protein